MNKGKKVLLFLVEGRTDEKSLGLIFSQILSEYEVRFEVISMDITSDWNSKSSNILGIIGKKVKEFLAKNPFIKKTDIEQVIQIVDMDGAFVSKEYIVDSVSKTTYYQEDGIHAKDRKLMENRNERKSSILNKLVKVPNVLANIPYDIFYFSCNLEHVLHDKINMDTKEKVELSYEFIDEFDGKLDEAENYFKNSSFCVKDDYIKTWEFMEEGLNSLHRYTNINLIF